MTHSFAQSVTLPCPACSQPVDVEVWLILDGQERPDLLELAREGILHQVTCPHCSQEFGLDAPLLVYWPDRPPHLLFLPPQQTSAEQDRELAAGLVSVLRGSLGDAWQEAWVEQMPTVPRQLLGAFLTDNPREALDQIAAQMEEALARLAGEPHPLSPSPSHGEGEPVEDVGRESRAAHQALADDDTAGTPLAASETPAERPHPLSPSPPRGEGDRG